MTTWRYGDWTTLEELPAGSLCETRDGAHIVKSAYPMGRFRKAAEATLTICFQLANGEEYICPNAGEVRPLLLDGLPPPPAATDAAEGAADGDDA